MLRSDYYACVCGHDAAFHCKQFTSTDEGTIVFNTYLHCELSMLYPNNFCKCREYKRDNLKYLEGLSGKL